MITPAPKRASVHREIARVVAISDIVGTLDAEVSW